MADGTIRETPENVEPNFNGLNLTAFVSRIASVVHHEECHLILNSLTPSYHHFAGRTREDLIEYLRAPA